MDRIARHIAFWSFQVINTLTALFMTFAPKPFHESLFRNPEIVYAKLGFSAIAVEMVHNVIRGHGAVLLAVSLFIWVEGWKSRCVYMLISLVCALSVYAHVMTLGHHLGSAEITHAIGSFGSLYGTIVITAAVGVISGIAYRRWEKTSCC